MKFLERQLQTREIRRQRGKNKHNRLGSLVQTIQKQEERNYIGRQFVNISPLSLMSPLQLLMLRGKWCCSDTKQQQWR